MSAPSNSWDCYIDYLIARTVDTQGIRIHADKACIISLDSGVLLTSDKHPYALKVSQKSYQVLILVSKTTHFQIGWGWRGVWLGKEGYG